VDPFSYLSVLISIILGLGITQLLTGLGRLINGRTRVRWYWPVVLWTVLLLVIHVQTWWAMFELRTQARWTFLGFLVVLLHPIVLYLAAAVVLPDAGGDATIDLEANYYAHARWLFGLLMALIVASLVRPVVLAGGRALDADFFTQSGFFVLAGAAVATRSRRFHEIASVTFAIVIVGYIALLFARLR